MSRGVKHSDASEEMQQCVACVYSVLRQGSSCLEHGNCWCWTWHLASLVHGVLNPISDLLNWNREPLLTCV